MIPNHARFLEAVQTHVKVTVRFFSAPDSGVLDRVCAPLDYGPGADSSDGLNRYWVWDYAGLPGAQTLGLVPQQIVELSVLGEGFDPGELPSESGLGPIPGP
jgi:hypothetical protein